MTDLDSSEARIGLEANEIRLFIGEPVLGLWCPICLLPNAWQAPVRRYPAEAPTSWVGGCTEKTTHPDRKPAST